MARTKNGAASAGVNPELKAQREYAKRMEQLGLDFGLTVADAFVRGIRDIGYRSPATALNELIDNAGQAGAENIHILFGFNPDSTGAKPDQLGVLDDGHGMDPLMIRLAMRWGGTHRENDRSGWGRYGYGLPSASISQGQRFTVYSWVEGGSTHSVTIDLADLGEGKYNKDGKVVVPDAEPAEMSGWVQEYIKEFYGDAPPAHGTLVLIDKVDRLTWKTTANLERHLLEESGVTYRNYLRKFNIFVNGKRVESVDPLFITPGYRYYDLDEDRAEALPPLAIDVKDERGTTSTINVRFAYLPPTFANTPREKGKEDGAHNARFPILKETNGIIVNRAGRQIDVLHRCPWTVFQNNDRYVKVEVDFPPVLDEEFSVTTSKQQVVPSERIWDVLKQHGVLRAISGMRERYRKDRGYDQARRDQDPNQKRPSELVMEETAKFKTAKPVLSVEREKEVQRKLKLKAVSLAEQLGMSVADIEKQLESEAQGRPYKIDVENLPGAPFYRMEQIGGQKVLYLNARHRWYTEVYAAPDSTPRWRAALEVMLFVMGDCELDAVDDRRRFYETERTEWSGRLNHALDLLKDHIAAPEPATTEEDRQPREEHVGAAQTS